MNKPLSTCCGVPLALSVSTRMGRRIICSKCGKPNRADSDKVNASAPPMTTELTPREAFLNEVMPMIFSKWREDVLDAFNRYELSLSKELVEKIEVGRPKLEEFWGSERLKAFGVSFAKDEDIAIIKERLEGKAE